uniref:Uncharacterized protein n=1 Tax=Panagrolaimus sp. ES5 TaxID=591445 RepID=A0AC34F4V4_9BILA
MILRWTLVIIFCTNLRGCVAILNIENEIIEVKTNISSFISVTAVDDMLDNELFSKAIDVLSLIPDPTATMRDKNKVLKRLDDLKQTFMGGICEINSNIGSFICFGR